MRILRALILVLVLANVLLFAAAKGYLRGGRGGEPERLADQLEAQKIVVLQAGTAPPAASDEGGSSVAAVEAPAAAPKPESTAAPPDACRRYAGLPKDRAARVAALAREAKLKLVQKSQDEPSSWWVNIPPQPSREEVDKRIAELRAAGINEFFVVQESGPNHFAISLGLFKLERMAIELRDKLRAKGVSQARVSARESSTAKFAVEVRGPADQVDGLVAQVATALPGIGAQSCQVAQ